MNFVHSYGFDVKEGRSRDFQQWLDGNEEKIAQESPEGTEYLGTYFAVQTSEKDAGNIRQLWRMDSYGAMDTWSKVIKDGGSFARLMDEYAEFIDQANASNWSATIMRKVTDAAVWGE